MDSTTKDRRYLGNEPKFLKFSYLSLKDHFPNYKSFFEYYQNIEAKDKKALFLRTASFYLFLVKRGDWLINIPQSDPRIGYITNTYKFVAIFSLIESLFQQKYLDFFEYLSRKNSNVTFPIKDKNQLQTIYRKYKREFGSINRCVWFFKKLSPERQQELIFKLKVQEVTPSIENFAKFLYELRSKFVHEAEFVHHMSPAMSVSRKRGKRVTCSLSIQDAKKFFEEGLIAHFLD